MWISERKPSLSKQGFVFVGYGFVAIGLGFSYLKSLFSRTPDRHLQSQPPQESFMLPAEFVDDNICLCIYAGESLTDSSVDHVHVILSQSAFSDLHDGDPLAWSFIIYIIGQEIAS